LPVDVWSHVAVTYDGNQVRLYVDGELVDCSSVPAGPPPVTEGDLEIGGASELGDYFKGRIDEVRLYERALNQAEITADMSPTNITEVAYAEDESGNITRASARVAYPTHGDQKERHTGIISVSITSYGPITEEANLTLGAELGEPLGPPQTRPYDFKQCYYDKGNGEGGGTEDESPVAARQLQATAKSAAVLRGCEEETMFGGVVRWEARVYGSISYFYGSEVWVDEPPKCSARGSALAESEEVELEEGKIEEVQRINRKPKRYNCFAKPQRGNASTHGLDVIGQFVWQPGKDWWKELRPNANTCGILDGHIPIRPPSELKEGGKTIVDELHEYYFPSKTAGETPKACDWEHPEEIFHPEL
jgi:hypothetical protein